MPAGPPYGNKNAEKWTLEESAKLLESCIKLAAKKCEYATYGKKISGYEFDFIGELACELDTYHDNITRDIPNRHQSLKPLVTNIIRLMERNCYSNTKKGIIKEATGIVNLKSNHKWTDRLDTTTKDEPINDIKLDASQIKKLIDKI